MIDKAKVQALARSATTRKTLWRFLTAVLVFSVFGFFVLPPLVKSIVLDQLSQALHRPVAIRSVHVNPYALSLKLEGVSVGEREGGQAFVSFDRLYINVESASLVRGGPVVGEVRLENPRLNLVRLGERRYNFSDLLDEFLARPRNDDPLPAFSLSNLQISGGVIEFDDQVLGEKHVVSEIALSLPFVSSLEYAVDSYVEPALSAKVDGAPLLVKGKSKPFADTLETEVTFEFGDVHIAKYIDYLPFKLPIKVDSGAIDATLTLAFLQHKDKPTTLVVSGRAALSGLDVKDASGAPLLSLKQFDVAVASLDPLAGRFDVERVAVAAPQIHARVSRDGVVNWIDFFEKQFAQQKAAQPQPAAAKPPTWSLGSLRVTDGALRWFDESHGKPFAASIEAIDLDMRKLDSRGKTPAEFDVAWRMLAEEWLKVDAFSAKGGQLDLAGHELRIDKAQTRGVRSFIRRTADGAVDWLKPPSLRVVEAAQERSDTPWKITVANYTGEDVAIRFEDGAVSPPVTQTIDGLGFVVDNLSTDPAQPARVAAHFKLNRKGEISVAGDVTPMPLDARLKLDAKTLELLPLQPYFSEKLNIDVTRGYVTLAGKIDLRLPAAGANAAAPDQALAGGFSGQATVGDFQAVDKLNSADFLRWKSFYLGQMDVRLNPDSISIGELALSDFFARVIVSPEGKLNLLQIVRHEAEPAAASVPTVAPAANAAVPPAVEGKAVASLPPATASDTPKLPIAIGKITLQGGTVRFTDNFVKPNYSANLRQIGGSLSGLSSTPGSVAKLELRGSYDNVAPLTVSAQINPLLAKPYLDLQAEIKGVELTSLSSYSAKYAGYAIDKGKLSLSVKYKIENDQLTAENRVFLDQLTFGERVDGPDATSLPVTLAVSLLKNRAGEIDIDLPISGSLNDPEFSVGGLVVKVIVNLLVKAVTSPFALLGSMFDGGEELAMVEFDYGRAAIGNDAQKRLATLAKALVDRPALKLEIEGRFVPELDGEGLKRARIERKVRAQKREELTRNDVESGSAEQVEVTPDEYPALLERVYRSEKFPKPRNMVGMVKELPVEEMEKLMMANSAVDDDDLRELGDRRARAVRDWLVAHEVAAERLFLLPSRAVDATQPGSAEKARVGRVDFTLK
jgi:uncharacterized protein involved in outer membrane biogenesis